MSLTIEKLSENKKEAVMPPTPGWITIQQLEQINEEKEQKTIKDEEQSLSGFLPKAAQKAQDLVNDIYDKVHISIPVSYLTIENNTTFHITMLVGQEDYFSPDMVKAKILAEKSNRKNGEFDMHYKFTINIEHTLKTSMVPDTYRLKHIPGANRTAPVELVYLSDRN